MNVSEVREMFQKDLFASRNGMRVEEVSEETTVCSVEIREDHMNRLGHVQGGVIFTLADFAFAVAANHLGIDTVTLNSNIHFLRAPKGKKLFATARKSRSGKTVVLYQVDVEDEEHNLVAQLLTSGYRRS